MPESGSDRRNAGDVGISHVAPQRGSKTRAVIFCLLFLLFLGKFSKFTYSRPSPGVSWVRQSHQAQVRLF